MSQIQTVPNVPYIADSNNEIDNLQYATLLTSTNDSFILQDSYQAIGVKSDGYPEFFNHGPRIIDGPETQSLITDIFNDILDSTTYPAASSVELFLLGGQQTVITYGTNNLSSPHQKCNIGPPAFLWGPGSSNYIKNCTENAPQLITFTPQPLSKPIMLDASIDVSSVSQSHPVTASLSAVVGIDINDPAFDIFTNLVTTSSTLSASQVNIEISYVKVIQNTNIPADATLRSTTDLVIPAINEALDKGDESLLQSEQTLEGVWNTGTGYWYSSQNASFPEFDYTLADQISAYNYNFDARAGQMALYRLNTIPVLSADRILTPVTDNNTGNVTYEISLSSQVNLLEAVWTQWRYLQGITETVYGVPALTATADIFKDDPTATTFIPELTGFNLIENINSIYTTVSGLSDTATECCNTLSVQMTAVSADLSEIKTDLYGASLTGTLAPSLTGDGLIEAVNTLYDDLGDIIGGDLDNRYVNLSGDTLQGPLILSRFPQQDMEATPKKWITDNYMPLSNVIPTITAVNTLRLQDSPVHPLDAVSKEYLDCKIYNFEQTFPRIPDLDLRYINLTGDHMAGPLHYSHDTNIDYGTIPANAVDFDIDISFNNKTFQTLRVYRTDVVHNIKLQNPGNGKITSIRLINMASGSIKVKFPPEYRFLSTYHGIINEGYSGIFSFTSFGNRDCDIYCAQAFECTPVEDLTCNEPSCDTRIGEINFTIPTSDCTPVIFTDINNTTAYNVLTSTDYCFKIEDSAVSHTVDGIDYKQAQLEFSEGTVVTVGQSPPQAGQPPRNSRCTFIWDVDDITGEQHKFYFGEENTYINRGIDDHEYKITYVGLGSFVFRVERIGVEAPPPPTPTPIIYNIDIGFTAVTAITGTEGFATSIEVKRFEDSMTMGACKVKYRTIEATALSGSDYVHTTGELEWYENDYSTRHITVPILNDSNYQDNNYFEVELYDPTYTSSKIIIYNNQVSFNLSPVKPNPVRVDIIDQTPAPIPPQIDFTIVNSQTVSAAEGDHAHIQVKRLESSTVSSACSATYDITSSGALSATPIIDYEDITGTLVWSVDDYSTHTVVIPFYSDGLAEGDEIFTFNITPISDDPNITYNTLISSQSVVIQDVT